MRLFGLQGIPLIANCHSGYRLLSGCLLKPGAYILKRCAIYLSLILFCYTNNAHSGINQFSELKYCHGQNLDISLFGNRWHLCIKGIDVVRWGGHVIIGLLANIPVHTFTAYLMRSGIRHESSILVYVGGSLQWLAIGAVGWSYLRKIMEMQSDFFSTLQAVGGSQSQLWPSENNFNITETLVGFDVTGSYEIQPFVHYYQDDAGINQLWISNKLPELVLEVMVFPLVIYTTRKYYLNRFAQAAGEQDQNIVVLSKPLESVCNVGEQGFPETYSSVVPALNPLVPLISEKIPDLVKIDAADIVYNARQAGYLTAAELFGKGELMRLRQQFLRPLFLWLKEYVVEGNQNRISKSPFSITGGQAHMIHHKDMMGVSWDEYVQLSFSESIQTGDFDLFIFRPRRIAGMTESLLAIEFDFNICSSPVCTTTKTIVPKGELNPVHSVFWGVARGGKFITVMGVDLIQKTPDSVEYFQVEALKGPNDSFYPVMSFEYELARLELALKKTAGQSEHDKYLQRLYLLALAQGNLLRKPGLHLRQANWKLISLIIDNQAEFMALPSTNKRSMRVFRGLIRDSSQNLQKAQASAKEKKAIDVYFPPSGEAKTEIAYPQDVKKEIVSQNDSKYLKKPLLPRGEEGGGESGEEAQKALMKKALTDKRKRKKKYDYRLLAGISVTAITALSVIYFALEEREGGSQSDPSLKKKKEKLQGASDHLGLAKQEFSQVYARWQYEVSTLTLTPCNNYHSIGFQKLCEYYMDRSDTVALALLDKMYRQSLSSLIPHIEKETERLNFKVDKLIKLQNLSFRELQSLLEIGLTFMLIYSSQVDDSQALEVGTITMFFCGYYPGKYSRNWYETCYGIAQEMLTKNNQKKYSNLVLNSLNHETPSRKFLLLLPCAFTEYPYEYEHFDLTFCSYIADNELQSLKLTLYPRNSLCNDLSQVQFKESFSLEKHGIKKLFFTRKVQSTVLCPPVLDKTSSEVLVFDKSQFAGKSHMFAFHEGDCIASPWSNDICQTIKNYMPVMH